MSEVGHDMSEAEFHAMDYEFCYVHGEEYGDHQCDDPPEDTDMTQAEFHAASATGVPVVVEKTYVPTDLRGPRCNLCDHQVFRLGMDWVCTENCRCVMIGCIPKKPQ